MPQAVPIILAASGIIGAGATVYGMVQGEKQRQAIDDAAGKAAWQAQQQKDELKRKQESDEQQKALIRTRDAQAMRMKVGALGAQGRSGTILTGPNGLGGSASAPGSQGGGKTMLGS